MSAFLRTALVNLRSFPSLHFTPLDSQSPSTHLNKTLAKRLFDFHGYHRH